MHFDVTITTEEIRAAWSSIQQGRNPIAKQTALAHYAGPGGVYSSATRNDFIGCSGKEMDRRLTEGYVPEHAPEIDADFGTEVYMPTMDLDEEGSLVLDAALAGEDFYRVNWMDKPIKRGLTIKAHTAFLAGTEAGPQISKYLDWVLAIVDMAQAQGIPVDLDLIIASEGSFTGARNTLDVTIPVFRAGETMDVAAWRAFLSPGSFRSLGFLSMGMAADREGRKMTSGLGCTRRTDWGANYDDEAGTLTITVAPMPRGEFPVDMMTTKVQAAFDAR